MRSIVLCSSALVLLVACSSDSSDEPTIIYVPVPCDVAGGPSSADDADDGVAPDTEDAVDGDVASSDVDAATSDTDSARDADADGDPDAAETNPGDDTDSTVGHDVIEVQSLVECAGAQRVIVIRNGLDTPATVVLRGDTVLRGTFAACAPDAEDVQVTIRSSCGGEVEATLSTLAGSEALLFDLESNEAGADVESPELSLSFAGEPAGVLTSSFSLGHWRDLDNSSDFTMDIRLRCVDGEPGPWSLVLDTPSEASAITETNGWPLETSAPPSDAIGCGVGEQFPAHWDFLDQFGGTDVSLLQFSDEMLIVEVGAEWCAPCVQYADRAEVLERRLAALDARVNVRQLSILVEDRNQATSTATTLSRWAERFEATSPILGGLHATGLASACSIFSFPTFFILDPNLEVRDRLEGFETITDLEERVRTAWDGFKEDNPEWTSSRCEGTQEPGNICGCIQDSDDDEDEDGVPDSCDFCPDAPDVIMSGGLEVGCTNAPPIPVREVDSIRVSFTARYTEESGMVGDTVSGPTAVSAEFIDSAFSTMCVATRELVVDTETFFGDSLIAGPVLGWRMTTENSTVTTDCDGVLNPLIWGENVTDRFAEINWAIAVTTRCGIEGCEGQDDEVWTLLGSPDWNDTAVCNLQEESCARALLGATLSFNSDTYLETVEGASLGFANFFPDEVDLSNPSDFARWLDIDTLRSGVPDSSFFGSVFMDGTEVELVGHFVDGN